jgi:hypothetical protein
MTGRLEILPADVFSIVHIYVYLLGTMSLGWTCGRMVFHPKTAYCIAVSDGSRILGRLTDRKRLIGYTLSQC